MFRRDTLTQEKITLVSDEPLMIPKQRVLPKWRKPYKYRKLNRWGRRVVNLRRTTGWTQVQFSIISGISLRLVKAVECWNPRRKWRLARINAYYPRLHTIRAIRLLEEAYAEELARFLTNPRVFDRLKYTHYERARRYYNLPQRPRLYPLGPPRDPRYIEALGGMAVFECLTNRSRYTPPKTAKAAARGVEPGEDWTL